MPKTIAYADLYEHRSVQFTIRTLDDGRFELEWAPRVHWSLKPECLRSTIHGTQHEILVNIARNEIDEYADAVCKWDHFDSYPEFQIDFN